MKNLLRVTLFLLMLPLPLWAQGLPSQSPSDVKESFPQEAITPSDIDIIKEAVQKRGEDFSKEAKVETYSLGEVDEVNYTLGAYDSIEIKLQSHPELSGT